ncbi:MAG TPA: hypothetical protein PLP66_15025 [Phycisphaerae bacterium]|nr:hypothetical protein [Phycisphaerae bacterium]HPM25219.1 hypothetical protein [Phycisphaerae bacterium]
MASPQPANTVLFWVMTLLGAAALAPCLVLPAWLERQAQLEYLQATEAHLQSLQARLLMARKQIEHMNNDPAYVLRLAEQDFGHSLRLSDSQPVQVVPGAPVDAPAPPPIPSGLFVSTQDELLPELSDFLARVMQRYPRTRVFVDSRTRPAIMIMGATLLLAAVVLLGLIETRPRRPRMPAGGRSSR